MADRAERRLTTVLAADVAEYSRLMRADEDGTLAALTACRSIIDELIAEHRGRIANTAGDSVLAEFPSVADGLSCALAIQRAIAEQNEPVAADRQLRFRIGLHLGDVLIRNGDLFGDAVNIAARLQALAEPGGICVSAAVREHAGTRAVAVFTDTGNQQVKNIAEPVHVFRLDPHPNPPPQAGEGSALGARVGAAAAPVPLALPDKPSVAVLPFTNMSADPEQEFFADGIAEDVITALSRYPALFVIARNSSFTYKSRAVDVKEVGRELGVRYVLEGGLRKSGNRIRVTAQLVEAETGKQVWAERYDRDLADIFAVQDEITEAVTVAVAPAIADAELHRAMRKPPDSLDAWAVYQRGLWHSSKFSPSDNALAQKLFRRAIDLDPTFAGGYTGLASAQLHAVVAFQFRNLPETLDSAEALARRAVGLDGADAEARSCLGWILLHRGDHQGARAEIEQALTISPNLGSALGMLGSTLIFSGWPTEGLAAVRTSMRLDPRHSTLAFLLNQMALGLYFSREYEASIEAAKRAIRSYPDFPVPYRWLAAALGQLGRTDEARAALEKAMALGPASFDIFVRRRAAWHRPEDTHMLDGLRKAGWQE
jgi:adenylate cyclase